MEFVTDYRLENYILQTTWEDLPEQIKQRAVVCSIDLTMALLLGSRGRQHAAGVCVAKNIYSKGDIAVVGSKERLSFMGAVAAMSHSSNSFDIDDGHNMIKGHPGTSFVAGVLAAALDKNVSYREYLTTLAVCYEITIRNGLAIQDHYKYLHSTGTYGAFGTAAGVGRIFGLTKEQLNNALSVAEFHAPITPVMRSVEYPSMNKDGVPFGALIGAMAVLETLCGTTGRGHLLEMPQYRYLLDTLGKRYEIMNLYFKPYTCCRWAHQPILASIEMMKAAGFSAADIDAVKIHTFKSASRLSKLVPTTTDEAQYNIAYPVAAAIVAGELGFDQVKDEALDNPEVLSMMKRLSFVMDPDMEKQFPEKRLAWAEFFLRDGRILRSDAVEAPGEASDNVDPDWITRKFMRITRPLLPPEEQQRLIALLSDPDKYTIREIVAEINKSF
ncbi:MAG TPA: MmgE/PrpD family protein [Clostridia bacterium]|nr:MmgE/PrpD family protein [Clostridia bacterium]